MKRSLFIVIILVFSISALQAQISSPGADANDVTQYPVFPGTDDIFIFCVNDSSAEIGTLTATTTLTGTKNWLWEKYDETTGAFSSEYEESTDATSSQINALADGCYRVTITQGATTEIDRAWVFNNWMYAGGEVTVSDCEHFVITGEMNSAVLKYFDLSNNTPVFMNKDVQAEWLKDGDRIASVINLTVYDPPTENTNYTLRVYDKFGCEAQATVLYESIVAKASFSASPMKGEAPLEVAFSNNSENGTAGYYEWFFFRDLNEIKEEIEGGATGEIDSIMLVAYDDAPVYTFENSGIYMVKLVAKHLSDSLTCVDTTYLDDYIDIEPSLIEVPNVFTPNGDLLNDEFVVNFKSMQSLEINIFNRWGKRVHYWKSGDVRGFEDTWAETVWDGKIGGRYASPGVYFYDVVGTGRDGEKHKKHGFVHLFRDKD